MVNRQSSMVNGLLKTGTLAGSMGVYVPAMVLHKAIGLARVLLFAHFLRGAPGELGLWYLGLMIFSVLGPLVCLGSNHALARYVSTHEARGELGRFYRRTGLAVLGVCLAMGLLAWAARGPITLLGVSACQEAGGAEASRQLAIATAAIANAVLLALYYNLLAFAGGMRLYRLTSAVEVFFGAAFAVLGCAALAWRADGLVLLWAHLASVGAALAAGLTLLHVAVRRDAERAAPTPATEALWVGPTLDEIGLAASRRRALRPAEFLRFALLALVGGELWVIAGQLSFYLTSRSLKTDEGALFGLYRQLAEPVAFLAAAAWTVLYGHVARAWEGGDRPRALFRLQTAYKAVALATMTVTVLVLAASPLWLRLLDERWRQGAALLPGLLLFFQMVGNLGLANLAAWLLERPALAMLPPAAGIATNLALAAWWMPAHGATGAAWAAGAGMAAGGGAAAALGLLLGRLRLSPSTWLVLLSPAAILPLALAAPWAPAAAWAAVVAAALATPWILDRHQKTVLREAAAKVLGSLRGRRF